ncbi:MAG: glycoside hydrolase family 88 protein [Pseudomonadota bacterium]
MMLSLAFLVATSVTAASAPTTSTGAGAVSLKVTNSLAAARAGETIALSIPDLTTIAPALDAAKLVVIDSAGRAVDSQLVDMDGDEKPDELVFQSAFAGAESRTFVVRTGDRRRFKREDFKVYGRFVRERHDDFVWENDRVAHRMYGKDLETWKAEPLTSSGVDVWGKRVRRLVANDWYLVDDYHQDSGEGADLYSVKTSRGCGGTGAWVGNKLHVSRNFTASRVLANGPIRLVFELTYAPWDAGGRMVSETKRVILDAGAHFNRFESTFKIDGAPGPLAVGFGIAKHEGGVVQIDKRAGWMRSWEPLKKDNGNLGCAVVMAPRAVADAQATELEHLLLMNAAPGASTAAGAAVVADAYVGSAWDKAGDIPDAAAWTRFVDGFARERAAPLRISMTPIKVATAVRAADAGVVPPGGAPAGQAGKPAPVRPLAPGSEGTWAMRTCQSVMARSPVLTEKWAYDSGLILKGCWQVGVATHDQKILDYVKRSIDHLIDGDGNIKGYRIDEYNLDHINLGKVLFPLLAATSTDAKDKERYRKALFQLRSQLKTQPRTSDGAFWHKLIYPRQMWLDGVYMASPFLTEFAVAFNEPALLDDVARQIVLAERHMREPKSGLLYHGWDETKDQRWANAQSGVSSQFWARAMGWYAMAIVDVLEVMPKKHPKREVVLGVLRRLGAAIASVQDASSGVWWQVLDAPARGQNFEEASASAMFVYALSKASANGWLDAKRYASVATRGYDGIIQRFVETDAADLVNVKGICKVAGLGGDPYRDGSFEYYTHTEVVSNDPKGVGSFILASATRAGM